MIFSSLTKSTASCLRSFTATAKTTKFLCLYSWYDFLHGRHLFHGTARTNVAQKFNSTTLPRKSFKEIFLPSGVVRLILRGRRGVLHRLKNRHRFVVDFRLARMPEQNSERLSFKKTNTRRKSPVICVFIQRFNSNQQAEPTQYYVLTPNFRRPAKSS